MAALNVVIIAAADLPEGGGETTRLKTMAAAIQAAGHTVQILLENPSGNVSEHLLQTEGNVNGIPFRYILGNTHALKGFGFFSSKYKAVKLLLSEIRASHKKKKIDVLWFNQLAFHTIYPLTRLARKLGIKIVHSYEDERLKGTGIKRKLIYSNQVLADKYMTRQANAIVAISYYLKDKYQKLTNGKVPIVIIPTIVDTDKWAAGAEPDNDIPVLLYYGGFFGFDEVEKMIAAVKMLKDRGIAVKLDLVGYNRKRPKYMDEIAELINRLELTTEVELKGFTPQDKLKEYLRAANLLIGLRKDDEWSQTGLSTKLSEYLATGRMVICSAIGDNTKYLEDGKSACLMPPGCTAQELANAIGEAIKDKVLRQQIGAAGRNVALNNFDTEVVKKNLDKMLREITN
ncbi:MAG: glycosyltransferase family 4 protein [Bacteroidetes bacterium]|nr:glycosyltransferase family 4 protein [Bacteroidota bacterium]